MDALDRRIVNALQGGFPLSHRPYAAAAEALGIDEDDLIDRLRVMLDRGVLSRFGPLFDAEKIGGAVTLAAMAVPEDRFDRIAALVNQRPEVAHNYRRDHALNMWFVVAAERPERIAEVVAEIAAETGLAVHDFPKEAEYFIGLRLDA